MLADGYINHSYGCYRNDGPRDPVQVPAENFLQAAPGWKWGDRGDPPTGKSVDIYIYIDVERTNT